jgi:DNA-binding response OmpR family regulator
MGGHVLVIEDDEGIKDAVGYGLRVAGYSVAEAADGDAGLRMARSTRPDVILLDLMVPGANGAELIGKLRGMAGGTQIVVMTAHDLDAASLASLGMSESALLRKPFSMKRLLEAVAAQARGGDGANAFEDRAIADTAS